MTKADFDYGELLIEKEREEQQKYMEEFGSKDAEIRSLFNEYLKINSLDGIDKLKILAFIHPVGQKIIHDTNWGRTAGFALILHNSYENPADSFLLKITSLDQLLYLMRTMRFLCYRYYLAGDKDAYTAVHAIFDELNLPENVRKSIENAAKVPEK